MKMIKAGRPAIDFIMACFRAGLSPLLSGAHGVGKSEIFKQAAIELGVDFVVRDLSLMEPTDLIGLPKMNGKTTIYLPPEFLPRSGQGILLFEEMNRCEKYMRAPCLQLMTNRTLNDYKLPDGWMPAAAINPDDGEYEVTPLDPALLSRFAKVGLKPDVDEWLAWAETHGIHTSVREYVSKDPSALEGLEANPRAWRYVSDALRQADLADMNGALRSIVLGLVGDERGIAFLRTLKQADRPLTAEAILSSYAKHRPKIRSWIETGKLDLVEATLLKVKKHLQPREDYESVRGDKKRLGNLARFLDDLPGDLSGDARKFSKERRYTIPIIKRRSED